MKWVPTEPIFLYNKGMLLDNMFICQIAHLQKVKGHYTIRTIYWREATNEIKGDFGNGKRIYSVTVTTSRYTLGGS